MRPIYLISKTPYPGVTHIPALTIRFLTPSIDFSRYDGLVFTSKQGIEALKEYSADWERLICVCVSEPTAERARAAGGKRVVSAAGYGESIPDVLEVLGRSLKWLYIRPRDVATQWVEEGRNRGLHIDEAVVYETACNPRIADAQIEADGVLVFTSPSSVRCFAQHHPILSTQSVVVIGNTTMKALPEGVSFVVSDEQSVASAVGLAREIAFSAENSSPF